MYHDPGSSARANVYRVPLLAGCPGREPAKGFFTLSAQSVKHHKMLLSEARHPEAYWRIPQETILDCVYDRCCRCSAVARESPGVGKCARKFLRPVRALTCIRFPLCLVRSRGIFRACGLRCVPRTAWIAGAPFQTPWARKLRRPGTDEGFKVWVPCGSLTVRGSARGRSLWQYASSSRER